MSINSVPHKVYAAINIFLPAAFKKFIRSFFTATITPWRNTLQKGHLKSSFSNKALDKRGNPIPWYTYPANDFLKFRNYQGKKILEFGAGQSTLWWAERCKSIISFEGSKDWYEQINRSMPDNVELYYIEEKPQEHCLQKIKEILHTNNQKFDIIIIDGLWRFNLAIMAKDFIQPDGAIVVDNSSGYNIYEAFLDSEFQRIDFYGLAPGVMLEACTSIFFSSSQCFLFNNRYKIFDIEKSY